MGKQYVQIVQSNISFLYISHILNDGKGFLKSKKHIQIHKLWTDQHSSLQVLS